MEGRSSETHVQEVYEMAAKTAVHASLLVFLAAVLFGFSAGRLTARRIELGRLGTATAAVLVAAAPERRRSTLDDVRQDSADRLVVYVPRLGHIVEYICGDSVARPPRVVPVEYLLHQHGRLLAVQQAARHRARQEIAGGHLQEAHR